MAGIKSSYDIAMEKMKAMGIDDHATLTDEDRDRISAIKKEYAAKIAEKQILLKGEEELPREIRFLEQERDKKIEAVYGKKVKAE